MFVLLVILCARKHNSGERSLQLGLFFGLAAGNRGYKMIRSITNYCGRDERLMRYGGGSSSSQLTVPIFCASIVVARAARDMQSLGIQFVSYLARPELLHNINNNSSSEQQACSEIFCPACPSWRRRPLGCHLSVVHPSVLARSSSCSHSLLLLLLMAVLLAGSPSHLMALITIMRRQFAPD